MASVIIDNKTKDDIRFLQEVATKIGLTSHDISDEEKEDAGLLVAMKKGRKTEFVSLEKVMNKLNKWV